MLTVQPQPPDVLPLRRYQLLQAQESELLLQKQAKQQ